MRISSVKARVLEARPSKSLTFGIGEFDTFTCVLVEVHADDGTVGYGEALARRGAKMTKASVEDLLTPLLVGKDPAAIEGLWVAMLDQLRRWGHSAGVVMEAISGVDIALWDLLGKAEGKPIWRLLNGTSRVSIPCYASSVYVNERDVMVAEAKEQVAKGFDAVKVKIGRSGTAAGLAEDIDAVGAIRHGVGREVEVMVDANGAYDTATAVRMCRRLEPLDIAFFEEPLPPDDMAGYERLHQLTTVPLARGETDFGIFGFNELMRRRAVDFLQPDMGRCGGITGARHTYTLAFANNVAFAPHTGFSGGVSQLAAIHAAAAAPALWRLEYMFIENPLREIFLEGFPAASDGAVAAPTGPGLGLELDTRQVEAFTVA